MLFSAYTNRQNYFPLFEIAYNGSETEIVVPIPG